MFYGVLRYLFLICVRFRVSVLNKYEYRDPRVFGTNTKVPPRPNARRRITMLRPTRIDYAAKLLFAGPRVLTCEFEHGEFFVFARSTTIADE